MWPIKLLAKKLIPHFPKGCKFLSLIDDHTGLVTQLRVLIPEPYRKISGIQSVTFYLKAIRSNGGWEVSISNTVDYPFDTDFRLKTLYKGMGLQVLGLAFLNFSHDFKQLRSLIIHDGPQ